jgi:heavy metal sensor kinase
MVVVFVAFYFLTQRSLVSNTDAAITVHNQKIADIVAHSDIQMKDSLISDSQIFAQQFSEMPGMLLVIGDEEGKIIYQSQDLGVNEAIINNIFINYGQVVTPIFINSHVGNTPMRFGIFPAQSTGPKILILMGQPMEVIQNSLNYLAATLIFVYLLLLGLAILGGSWLARKAMNPIVEVSNQLKTISAENLQARVPNPKTGDEIEELSHSFNTLLNHLNEAFIRERQFIGDVAHELKTPLATLKSEIEVTISKNRSNTDYQQALNGILIDANRLSNTINNILDLAWIGADSASLDDRHFNLSLVINELTEIAEKLAAQKSIEINSKIETGVVINGNEDKIYRAVLNVIDNAIKYTPKHGKILISLTKSKDTALIEVADTGIGISKSEQEHIFKRFYRGSKVAKTLGSGLGLAIAEGIVKAHHGLIEVNSQLDRGTKVSIKLPLPH